MNVRIKNAQNDQYGNQKENIFLAMDEQDHCIGSGYVYPTVNRHQTNETPYLLFCSINPADELKEEFVKGVRQALFDAVYARAVELRAEKKELTARIYAGFERNPELLEFYLSNGFEEDYSIFMEKVLDETYSLELPAYIRVEEFRVEDAFVADEFKQTYDEIFVTPMDIAEFREAQREDQSFKNFYFYCENQLVGECSVREEGEYGWIETLFVLEEARGKGMSIVIMNYIHAYFKERGRKKSRLEVWELNKRAVSLYQKMGYAEYEKNCMFPGKTV
ncbi:MAG: GNAT family N-acetyltransferase [Lachnospiraceae bacterium]|nr:GNAT family N-acetyltransferase [Lachnospiraceae bacterium]